MNAYTDRRFNKRYAALLPKVKARFKERYALFLANPFDPVLENHPLHGEYAGCRSINVTGDYRAIFYHENENTVRFIAIGTHHELFGT